LTYGPNPGEEPAEPTEAVEAELTKASDLASDSREALEAADLYVAQVEGLRALGLKAVAK